LEGGWACLASAPARPGRPWRWPSTCRDNGRGRGGARPGSAWHMRRPLRQNASLSLTHLFLRRRQLGVNLSVRFLLRGRAGGVARVRVVGAEPVWCGPEKAAREGHSFAAGGTSASSETDGRGPSVSLTTASTRPASPRWPRGCGARGRTCRTAPRWWPWCQGVGARGMEPAGGKGSREAERALSFSHLPSPGPRVPGGRPPLHPPALPTPPNRQKGQPPPCLVLSLSALTPVPGGGPCAVVCVCGGWPPSTARARVVGGWGGLQSGGASASGKAGPAAGQVTAWGCWHETGWSPMLARPPRGACVSPEHSGACLERGALSTPKTANGFGGRPLLRAPAARPSTRHRLARHGLA
jgi:hypothetical protein